ncbi:hypothetical protein diail_9825 [Diaporthe ilicicola]|nr:hypothetical protein diail_9825 [Diaporthe ilicicola]
MAEIEQEEKDALLQSVPLDDGPLEERRHGNRTLRRSRLSYAVGFLSLSNLAFIAAIFILLVQKTALESAKPPSWAPPEHRETRLFEYLEVYGSEPSLESEDAWSDLIPMGKGFIKFPNDTVIPDMPGLNRSLPEQRAVISVFHQLHCLFMTRAGYFSAKSGNLDEVNMQHLSHCWDYLRQAIMCHSDTTLEWLGPPPHDRGSTGWGYEHQCRDYTAVFEYATAHRLTDNKNIHS